MRLAPRELDKLILAQTGFLAQRRLARGLQLNLTEATALIASVLQERIRHVNPYQGVSAFLAIITQKMHLLSPRKLTRNYHLLPIGPSEPK